MPVIFLDTSATVKRYVAKKGSSWLLGIVDPTVGNRIYTARITAVETVSAFSRRGRGGSLTPTALANAITEFRHDLATQYEVIEITAAVISQAMNLAEKYALRGYDAVQLATALEVNYFSAAARTNLTVISADVELNSAAIAEGLTVEDPNNH